MLAARGIKIKSGCYCNPGSFQNFGSKPKRVVGIVRNIHVDVERTIWGGEFGQPSILKPCNCLLYTNDAADEYKPL